MSAEAPDQMEHPYPLKMNNLSSTSKIVNSKDEVEPYEPWKNRNLTHPLGTTGALFHLIKGSLGSGILAMPVAFKNGGLWTSLVGAIFVGIVYIHCAHILVHSCQVLCIRLKKPRLAFAEIAEGAFSTGPHKWRPYAAIAKDVVDIGLLLTYYLCCIVYIVFTASSIKQVVELNFTIDVDIRIYILMVTVFILPIGLIRNLKYLVPFSFIAICTLTFGCGFVLYDIFSEPLPPLSSRPAITSYNRLPLFFSTIIYSMDGIGTVLPIENAMDKPQHFLGCPGVLNISMVWLILLYCAMGFFGYLRYGDATEGSITLNINSSAMGQVVKLMVSLNVLCSYGLFLYVPCEIIWRKLENKVAESTKTCYHYLMRLVLILLSVVIATIVPDLEPFVGLVGAVCSSTLVLFFPPVIETVTFWEDKEYLGLYRWKLYKNAIMILMWLVTLVTGTQAAIVGFHTKKVLYIGVKNKYCTACARSQDLAIKPAHTCFKNWTDSSSSMESAVIVEGFLCSEDMYGVRYAKIVADGDSSVYQRILETRPYVDLTVVKIECRNHLLRNYSNKLKEITTSSDRSQTDRATHIKMRKLLGGSLMRLRAAVTKAIAHRKKDTGSVFEKTKKLRGDIINGPSHVFGEHQSCDKYFCKGSKEGEKNNVGLLKKCGLYAKIMNVVGHLADHSKDLIYDIDSNVAEHYNSVVARLIGGKRINYCLKGSYQARCSAAVVSYNSARPHYKLHKTMYQKSPGKFSKLFEERSKRKILLAKLRRTRNPRARRRIIEPKSKSMKYYGPLSQKPDLDEEIYKEKVSEHMARINISEQEMYTLQQDTLDQANSEIWREERRIRLTASNFGVICNRKAYSNSSPVVNSLLYTTLKECSATAYGKDNEAIALSQVSVALGKPIAKCGLFIDRDLPFLGATPDGLIDDDGIVEVKCPFAGKDFTPEEVIENKLGLVGSLFSIDKQDKSLRMKKKHRYHFQIQGQLHITRREYCEFVIWTPKGIKMYRVHRDNDFWCKEMKIKLTAFYMDCLLPELLDPRRRRSMPLREPHYIRDAQRLREEKKELVCPRLE